MAAGTDVSPGQGLLQKIGLFARLVKFQFVIDFFLAFLIVWTALDSESRFDGHVLLTFLLFALGKVGVLSAVMTLDDVMGIRDGSDSANYLGEDNTELRPLKRKPLLTGELPVRHALLFGYAAWAWGAAWWALAVAQAPHAPAWAVVVASALLLFSVQYSWGLKLSYVALGEVLLLYSASAFVLAPYGIIAGDLPALVLVEALLFGFGQLLIAGYSNTNDASGDGAVGRRTVAVLTSDRGNKIFLGILTALNLLVIVGPSVLGWVPWWFALALAPFMAVRIKQYGAYLHNGQALVARSRGVVAFRTTVVCILVFNLLHFTF